MYAAKIILGTATVVLSGSLWFVPTTVYLIAATLRAMHREPRKPRGTARRRGRGR